jgi:hypothetical protein
VNWTIVFDADVPKELRPEIERRLRETAAAMERMIAPSSDLWSDRRNPLQLNCLGWRVEYWFDRPAGQIQVVGARYLRP